MALNQVGLERLNSATTDKLGERKNKIINGNMIVSQRHGTAVVTGVNSTGYRIDRWTHQIDSINSAFSVSQSTDTPDEFGNSYKIDVTTADTSLAAAHAHFFRQKIEGQNLQDFAKGTSSAKQYAVSFYVKTNKTGLYTVELYDVDNNRQCSKTFTVADSNWNRYTLIYPADTTGAFDNDNNNSLVLQFWLSAGSNFTSGTLNSSAWASATTANRVSSSNVNLGDNTSNEWYLTGVQLEVGSVATEFEHRSLGQELELCKRYFFVIGKDSKRNNFRLSFPFINEAPSNTGGYMDFRFHPEMRATPTATIGSTLQLGRPQVDMSSHTVSSFNNMGPDGCHFFQYNNQTGSTGDADKYLRAGFDDNSFAEFSAEL